MYSSQIERKLIAIAWKWLIASGDKSLINYIIKYIEGDSMTLANAALEALSLIECEARDQALERFYDRWKDRPIILDNWFKLKASTPSKEGINSLEKLFIHSRFDSKSPNSVRKDVFERTSARQRSCSTSRATSNQSMDL